MFRNRKITVTVDKVDKGANPGKPEDDKSFKENAEFVLRKLEGVGKKVFLGVCIYVVLDTQRQVAIAKANNPE